MIKILATFLDFSGIALAGFAMYILYTQLIKEKKKNGNGNGIKKELELIKNNHFHEVGEKLDKIIELLIRNEEAHKYIKNKLNSICEKK